MVNTWIETSDVDNAFDGTVYTAPSDGVYHFAANLHGDGGAVRDYLIEFRVNGIAHTRGSQPSVEASTGNALYYGATLSSIIPLTAGDQVEVRVYQHSNTGATRLINIGIPAVNNFTGYKINN